MRNVSDTIKYIFADRRRQNQKESQNNGYKITEKGFFARTLQ